MRWPKEGEQQRPCGPPPGDEADRRSLSRPRVGAEARGPRRRGRWGPTADRVMYSLVLGPGAANSLAQSRSPAELLTSSCRSSPLPSSQPTPSAGLRRVTDDDLREARAEAHAGLHRSFIIDSEDAPAELWYAYMNPKRPPTSAAAVVDGPVILGRMPGQKQERRHTDGKSDCPMQQSCSSCKRRT